MSQSSILHYSCAVAQKTKTTSGPSPGRQLRFAALTPHSAIHSRHPPTEDLRAVPLEVTESFVSGTTKTFYSTQKTPLVLGVQNYFQSSLYVLSFFVLPLAKGSTVHTDTILFGRGRGVSRGGPDLHTLFWIFGKNHENTMVKVSGSL